MSVFSRPVRWTASVVCFVLLLAACGEDPAADDTAGTDATAPSDTAGDTGADTGTDTGTGATTTDGEATDGTDTEPGTTGETGDTDDGTETGDTTTGECVPVVNDEITQPAGLGDNGVALSPAGREVTPRFPQTVVEGFPAQVVAHPTVAVAYVSVTGRNDRNLLVINAATGEIVQNVVRDRAFYGIAVAADGSRVYASSGISGLVEYYDAAADGTLTRAGEIAADGYTSGLALSPDGARLWVGLWDKEEVVEFDTATGTQTRLFEAGVNVWDVVYSAATDTIAASTLMDSFVALGQGASGALLARVETGRMPAGMALSPDGKLLFVAEADNEAVSEIDLTSRTVKRRAVLRDDAFLDVDGTDLPHVNANSVALDPAAGRLYVSMGAYNGVGVIDLASFEVVGVLPTSWYPAGVAVSAVAGQLVVAEGKGGGAGPNQGQSAKSIQKGALLRVPLDLDATRLGEETAKTRERFLRPRENFTFTCPDGFPVPPTVGQPSPIEHVILIFKENKTFDCVFGDVVEGNPRRDATLAEYGERFTPNAHKLAREFSFSDNFYTEVPNSDNGHTLMTATHLTEYFERVWLEPDGPVQFTGFQLGPQTAPRRGNLFTHLLENKKSIRIYGEIVGMTIKGRKTRRVAADFSDTKYPGGIFINYKVKDELKGQYVADRIAAGELAQFTYISLPNDHTNGTAPGTPSPESMIADNDRGMGIIIEALSKSPFWAKSAVFVLQDDTQGCEDHIDAYRSLLLVVSPYAKRGYLSRVHGSMSSVHATIEHILGVSPMGRVDAAAAPLWDMFTTKPDFTPYTSLPRSFPEELNPANAVGARLSEKLNMTGADRSPLLGDLLKIYHQWRKGRIDRATADRQMAELESRFDREPHNEELDEEASAFDTAIREYRAHLRATRGAAAEAAIRALGLPDADAGERD
jgi:DNA-binding beta-propeller fold protein YncE